MMDDRSNCVGVAFMMLIVWLRGIVRGGSFLWIVGVFNG
jgi:hypothetical protein